MKGCELSMANETIIEKDYRLTTLDNPFDPFENFVDWYSYDMEKGYNCCGYVDRIAHVTDDMSQKESSLEIERAIDEIIEKNPLSNYKKVERVTKIVL